MWGTLHLLRSTFTSGPRTPTVPEPLGSLYEDQEPCCSTPLESWSQCTLTPTPNASGTALYHRVPVISVRQRQSWVRLRSRPHLSVSPTTCLGSLRGTLRQTQTGRTIFPTSPRTVHSHDHQRESITTSTLRPEETPVPSSLYHYVRRGQFTGSSTPYRKRTPIPAWEAVRLFYKGRAALLLYT